MPDEDVIGRPIEIGDRLRLRAIDISENLHCAVYAPDMDGFMYEHLTEEVEEHRRVVVITEFAYSEMVRRMREAGISRI